MPTPLDPLRAHNVRRVRVPERDPLDDMPDKPKKRKAAGRPADDPEMYAIRVASAGFERLVDREQAVRVMRYLALRYAPGVEIVDTEALESVDDE